MDLIGQLDILDHGGSGRFSVQAAQAERQVFDYCFPQEEARFPEKKRTEKLSAALKCPLVSASSSSPISARRSVVFAEPDSPRRATNCPAGISSEIRSRAVLPLKLRERSRRATALATCAFISREPVCKKAPWLRGPGRPHRIGGRAGRDDDAEGDDVCLTPVPSPVHQVTDARLRVDKLKHDQGRPAGATASRNETKKPGRATCWISSA